MMDASSHLAAVLLGQDPRRGDPRGAIRVWTSDTAVIFGIEDRGVLREDAYADINVIDFDNLAMENAGVQTRLPRRRRSNRATRRGHGQLIVNGQVFMEHGEHMGALSGRMLRS